MHPLDPKSYWDSQLKFSAILPQFEAYLARMARDSADFSQGRRFDRADTGPDTRQWVEWTAGSGAGSIIPVVIHGGYWRALRAEDHRFLMASLLQTGPVVGNIEYRLKPEHALSDCIRDAAQGIKALTAQFDGSRLLLLGHSAGAHLALSVARDPALRQSISGIIALSGVYDLAPVAVSSLQDEIGLTDAEISQFSLRPSEDAPPTLFVTGAQETSEFLRGAALMASRGRTRAVVLDDANHMTLTWAAATQMNDLVDALRALGQSP